MFQLQSVSSYSSSYPSFSLYTHHKARTHAKHMHTRMWTNPHVCFACARTNENEGKRKETYVECYRLSFMLVCICNQDLHRYILYVAWIHC